MSKTSEKSSVTTKAVEADIGIGLPAPAIVDAMAANPAHGIVAEGKSSKEQTLAESTTNFGQHGGKTVDAPSHGDDQDKDDASLDMWSIPSGKGISAADVMNGIDPFGRHAEEDFSFFDEPTEEEMLAALPSHITDITTRDDMIASQGSSSDVAAASQSMLEMKTQYDEFTSKYSVADGQAGTAPVGIVYDDEEGLKGGKGSDNEAANAASKLFTGLYSNKGEALQQALDEQDSIGRNVESTHTSKDGVVTSTKYSDGTIVVSNKDSGTTTTLKPDGSSTTTNSTTGEVTDRSGVKCPSGEYEQVTLAEKIAIREKLGEGLHVPNGDHSGDDVDPVEDDSISGGSPSGNVDVTRVPGVDCDPVGPGDGPVGGVARVRTDPQLGGDIDPTDDADAAPQTGGPEDDPFDQGPQVEAAPPSSDGDDEAEDSFNFADLHAGIGFETQPMDIENLELLAEAGDEGETAYVEFDHGPVEGDFGGPSLQIASDFLLP